MATSSQAAVGGSAWWRLWTALRIVLLLELGMLLLVIPWTRVWQHNYFTASLGTAAWWLSPFFKGAISGLGLVNLWLGTGEISHFRR